MKKISMLFICSILVMTIAVISGTVYAKTKNVTATITAIKAKQIALAKTGGGTVVKCVLDYENGRKVYEIEIVNGNKKYDLDVGVADSNIYNYEEEVIKTTPTKTTTSSEITATKAKEISLAKTGGGTVVKCVLDYENGRKVYEIEIVNGNKKYDLDVGVADSNIYNYEEKTINNSVRPTKPTTSSEITATKAKEIALKKTGGGKVKKCQLDYEDGRKVYEIDIIKSNKEYEMYIGVSNGQIYEYEVETIMSRNTTSTNTDRYDD